MHVLLVGAGGVGIAIALDSAGRRIRGQAVQLPELRGRVAALLRRSQPRHGTRITQVGALRIHDPWRQVRVGETRIDLSAEEFALLVHLAADPTRVFTKDELLREIWGFQAPARTRTRDSHACRLRR